MTTWQDPYGNSRGTPPSWIGERGFVGGTKDATGLTRIGARDYDPVLQRFITVDPLQDLADPLQWNPYLYANNSPITKSDPTGLWGGGPSLIDGIYRPIYYKDKKGKNRVRVEVSAAEKQRRAFVQRQRAAKAKFVATQKAWRPKQRGIGWRPAGTSTGRIEHQSASTGHWVPPGTPVPRDPSSPWQRLGILAMAAAAPIIIQACVATGLAACATVLAQGEVAAASGGSVLGVGGAIAATRVSTMSPGTKAGLPRDALGRFKSGAGGESATTVAGRSAHKSYVHTLGGGDYVFNRALPGSRMRPDAVSYSQNIVRELKPDNPEAIARGWRQVNTYRAYLEAQTGQAWTAYVDVYKP